MIPPDLHGLKNNLSKRTKSVKAIYLSTFSNSHYALSENEICSNISEFENTPNLFSCGHPFGSFWSVKYLNLWSKATDLDSSS